MAYIGEQDTHFEQGNRGLLVFMGQRFLVSILSSDDETVRISFPVSDFPVEGMYVNLEFHDEAGYISYETEVLAAAREAGDGLLLKRPENVARTHHRNSWRIPTDFRVEVKDHVHPRRTEAPAINLSAGGLLLRTLNIYEVGDNIDMQFRLPGETQQQFAVGQVVHVTDVPLARDRGVHVGVKFVALDPVTQTSISNYIWRRLRELHPQDLKMRRRSSDTVRPLHE